MPYIDNEDDFMISLDAEKALFEYEEARREHEDSQLKLRDALDLKRKIIHYHALVSLLLSVEKEVNPNVINNALDMSDILTGRQKRGNNDESQEVIIQRMRLENNELRQELQFWQTKDSDNNKSSSNGADFIELNEDREGTPITSGSNGSSSLRKSIKFSRRLTSPSKVDN